MRKSTVFDISKYYEKAREIDKKNGKTSSVSTPSSVDMSYYYAKARKIDNAARNNTPNLGNNGTGGTFLGGYRQPVAKKKRVPTAAEIAAQQKEADDAAKYIEYLKALDLDYQQTKIDALKGAVDAAPKYNIRAFGGYDPNSKTVDETALAKAQEDYNLARSIQYSEKGKKALGALDLGTQHLIDSVAKYNIKSDSLRSVGADENAERERNLNALLSKGYTMEEIAQLVDYRVRQINEDEYIKKVQKMEELAASEDFLGIRDAGAVAASVASVPLNLGSGLGYLDLLRQKGINAQLGYDRPLNYNTAAMSLYGQADAARSTVSQRIMDNAETEFGGEVGAFLYQTGMSMADSAVVATLGGLGLGASGTLLLGGSAATAAAVDAKNRGGSDEQALLSGAFAGAAEAVFEKVSIDNLLKKGNIKTILGGEFKQLASEIGKQSFVEGSEEVFTEFANFISDQLIMGGSSAYEQSVREYMAQGMTEDDARARAAGDFAIDCATAFIGGAISGGIMGGAVSASRMDTGNNIRKAYAQAYAEDTLRTAPESPVATQVMEKVSEGKKVSGRDIKKLERENQQAVEKARRESAMAEVQELKKPPSAKVETAQNAGESMGKKAVGSEVIAANDLVYQAATEKFGSDFAHVVAAGYKTAGDVKVSEYLTGFNAAYEAGKKGVSVEEAIAAAPTIQTEVAQEAWQLGVEEKNTRVVTRSIEQQGSGKVTDETTGKATESWNAYVTLQKAIAQRLGADINLVDEVVTEKGAKANAALIRNTMTFVLSRNSQHMIQDMGHEMAEFVEAYNPEGMDELRNDILAYWSRTQSSTSVRAMVKKYQSAYQKGEGSKTYEQAETEALNDAIGAILSSEEGVDSLISWLETDSGLNAKEQKTFLQKLGDLLRGIVESLKKLVNNGKLTPMQKDMVQMEISEKQSILDKFLSAVDTAAVSAKESGEYFGEEVSFSLERNDELMGDAEEYNDSHLGIELDRAREQRQAIYDFMMKNAERLKLPEDIEGDTAVKNSSYGITEENTTVCIRSMAADALCDAIAEDLGRPLTVQDTLLISQDLMNYTDEPECVYCYVATDRRAYREFLGSYYKQMQSAIEALRKGESAESVYQSFLDGRKDTKNMKSRFAMWQEIAEGGKMISSKDLASEKMMQKAMKDPALAPQVKDARAYAQSASWAKKRVGYRSYNGHILKWTQRRINDLNKHYGLRFYSFSDFSPAFILENMQQMTDAAVRGLKGLAYTKVLDFAEIFAPTGININVSVFGYDQNGTVAQDGMMGADWKGAQDLRNRYENVGITFVATNDSQIEWALGQDWIDVVIPYHLVRTGQAVAKHFGYTNYTAESGDTKGANWRKGGKKTIYPAEHNNDKQTYLNALKEADLEPRFARWVDNPNYMKLVNETRRAAKDTPPMQAVFNVEAAKASLERMAKQGGYFVPIGGDYANMQDIATEIADKIRSKYVVEGDASYSIDPDYESKVREWYENTTEEDRAKDGGYFRVGTTSKALQSIGVKDRRIFFRRNKIATILDKPRPVGHKGDVSIEDIVNVPKLLENPVAILKSTQYETSIVVVGEIKTALGNTLTVVLELSPKVAGNMAADISIVTSAYDRDKKNLKYLLRASEVLYLSKDKKRTDTWLMSLGAKYPSDQPTYGSMGRVTYDGEKVKSVSGTKIAFEDVKDTANSLSSDGESMTEMTNREILEAAANANEGVTEGEKDALKIFQKRLKKLNDLQAKRKELGAAWQKQQFGGDRNEAVKTRNRMQVVDGQIENAEKELIAAEKSGTLQGVVDRARKEGAKVQKKHDDVLMKRYRERRKDAEATKKYRERITKKVKKMSDMLLKNSDKQHIPEVLKGLVGEFISTIDFTSKQQLRGGEATQKDRKFINTLDKIHTVLDKQAKLGDEGTTDFDAYLDLPDGFTTELKGYIDKVRGAIEGKDIETPYVNMMSAAELEDLDFIVGVIYNSINKANELLASARYKSVSDAAETTIFELAPLKEHSGKSGVGKFLNWDNTTPVYAFKRFGAGGRAVFEGLQDGWDKFALNAKAVIDFAKNIYTAKEVKEWSNKVHTFEIDGREVQMTTTQVMSLYCLMKREQAQGHIFGGGMRIGNFATENGRLKKKSSVQQTDAVHPTLEHISTILNVLTDRQISVADALQNYMNTVGTEWGNAVSMARFGYKAFGEENYFPIVSDSNNLPSQDPGAKTSDLYRLLNMCFTKSLTPKANNALVVDDIFEVFAAHMSDMAKYNALALPVLDAMKFYNYKQTTKEGEKLFTSTVQKAIEKAYGKDGQSYFIQFMKDLNGVHDGGKSSVEKLSMKMVSNYKIASVGANLRVAFLQPTSLLRAGVVIDPKYLAKALTMKPAVKEMLEHSGIAVWKDLGFYDVDIGRGVRDQIKHEESFRDKAIDKSMIAAEMMDRVTWGALWNACKLECTVKGEKDLMAATAKRFREVVYASQVVDSTMTRSQTMRSNNSWTKILTSFMSEPTLSFNTLLDAYNEYETNKRKGIKNTWETSGKKIARGLLAYGASAAGAAVAESIFDALRDDDDYETFLEKFWEAFWLDAYGYDGKKEFGNLFSDLNPANKLPIIKDVFNEIVGFENNRMDTQWLTSISDAIAAWKSEPRPLYGKIYKTLQAVSRVSGLPLSNISREVATIYNNTIGTLTDKKLKTWEPTDYKGIKEAFEAGHLTKEEAAALLVEKCGYTASKAKSKAAAWEYQSENPDTALSDSRQVDFVTYARPAGISVDVFQEYVDGVKDAEGKDIDGDGKSDKKAIVEKLIHSLPISTKQKDVLYLLDYAESGLYETPWH